MCRGRWGAVLLAFAACHRPGRTTNDGGSQGADAGSLAGRPAALASPIAAARTRGGTVMVAGLVPSRGVVVAANVGDDHATRGWVDVLSDVSGGPNVELHVFPTTDGAAVVYRGRRADRSVTLAALVDSAGHVSPSFEAGAAACATDEALAWIEKPSGGASRILQMPWGRTTPEEVARVPAERDPALVCATRTIFTLGDGERDTTLTTFPPTAPSAGAGAPARPRIVVRDRDFADEEREHDTFVVGDALGLVRVGQGGAVAVRDVGVEMSPWRRLGVKLTEADDLVAVDGDLEASNVVFTREEASPCDGPSTPSVHAERAARASAAEVAYELAPATCDRELGPFWTGTVAAGFVVAWVERASVRTPRDPAVTGLAYRTIASTGLGELRRLARPADEIVDAGCDKDRCYAVALVPSGADGPETIELLTYP